MTLPSRAAVGIEIGSHALRLCAIVHKPVLTILRVVEVKLNPGDELQLGQILIKALAELGAKSAEIHLAFAPGATPIRHQLFSAPKLARNELKLVAARELKKDQALDAGTALIEVEALGIADAATRAQSYLIVALLKETVVQLAVELIEAGLELRSITSSTMAVLRLCEYLAPRPQGVTAVVQVDEAKASLVILDGVIPRFCREFPSDLAAAAARGGEEQAVSQLSREVELSLVYFSQQHRPKQVEAVFLAGPDPVTESIGQWLAGKRPYQIGRPAPGETLHVRPEVIEALAPYGAALGSTLGPPAREPPNLLPPEYRRRSERARIAIVAGIAVVLVFGGLLQLRSRHSAAAEVEHQRVERAQREYDRVAPLVLRAAALDKAGTDTAAWKKLLEAATRYHFDLGGLLHELPAALPPTASLRNLRLGPPTADGKPRKAVPGKPAASHRLQLEGVLRTGDPQAAQDELRTFVKAAERLPHVQSVELAPIKTPALAGGYVEVTFQLELVVVDPYPIKGGAK